MPTLHDSFESSSVAASPKVRDHFTSEASLQRRLQEQLREEFASQLPPLYLQARALSVALANGRPLPHRREHYIGEMRQYLSRQRNIFSSLGVEPMLVGLDLIAQALDELSAKGGPVDGLLDQALKCFLAARNSLGHQKINGEPPT